MWLQRVSFRRQALFVHLELSLALRGLPVALVCGREWNLVAQVLHALVEEGLARCFRRRKVKHGRFFVFVLEHVEVLLLLMQCWLPVVDGHVLIVRCGQVVRFRPEFRCREAFCEHVELSDRDGVS